MTAFHCCGRLFVVVALLATMLAACGSATETADSEAALATTRAFVAALEARDPSAILATLEPADWRREIGPELRSYISYVEALEFRNSTYEVLSINRDSAEIRMQATLHYRLRDFEAGEQPIDTVFELVRVEQEWYLRSLSLPTPGS